MELVFGDSRPKNMNKLLILQKRALRLIYFAQWQTHAIPYFIETNILPINLHYYEEIANLMHNVVNNIAPNNLSKLFTNISEIHSYSTRASKSNKLFTEGSRTSLCKKSFSKIGASIWNKIPESVRNLTNKAFRVEIKRRLFSILESEETYVELADLIRKIKM